MSSSFAIYLHLGILNMLKTFLLMNHRPHSHLLMMGGPSDFFGSEILAKGNFFGSMKDAKIFWGHEKITEGFFGFAKKELRDFLGCVKKVVIFWEDQFRSCDFFGYKI